eukprot:254764-Chlamydomonas_euryale.AAC.1
MHDSACRGRVQHVEMMHGRSRGRMVGDLTFACSRRWIAVGDAGRTFPSADKLLPSKPFRYPSTISTPAHAHARRLVMSAAGTGVHSASSKYISPCAHLQSQP